MLSLFTVRRRTARWAAWLSGALAAAMLTIAAPFAGVALAAGSEGVHVVAKGQTLGRIAKRYNTTVEALRTVNELERGEPIRPGLVLVIPEKGKEAEATRRAAALRKERESTKAARATGKEKTTDKRDGKAAPGKAEAKGGKKRGVGAEPAKKYAAKPKRPGYVRIVHATERFEGQVLTRQGRLVPKALPGLGRILRHYASNKQTPIDPRLATLLGMVSDHFGGRTIHVVSGFRPYTPEQHTRHSNHNAGRAVDFTVEGVPNTVVRDFCRNFRNAGVGYYPNSTFVHLDVRSEKVYWVDYSGPGEAPRYGSPAGERHAGGGHASTQAASPSPFRPQDGSVDTPSGAPQLPETSAGKSDAADRDQPNSKTEGPSGPTRAPDPG